MARAARYIAQELANRGAVARLLEEESE